ELEAAPAVLRVVRREKAALSLVVERERAERQRKDRGVEELDAAVAHVADLGFAIERQLARLDPPVLPARGAAREGAARHAVAALAEELRALGPDAHGAHLALQDEVRLLEHAGVVLRVVAQPRPEEAVLRAQHAHAAVGLDPAELLVVAQEFRVD